MYNIVTLSASWHPHFYPKGAGSLLQLNSQLGSPFPAKDWATVFLVSPAYIKPTAFRLVRSTVAWSSPGNSIDYTNYIQMLS